MTFVQLHQMRADLQQIADTALQAVALVNAVAASAQAGPIELGEAERIELYEAVTIINMTLQVVARVILGDMA